ncbi:RidA family protein [Burkholderia sp. Ac-20353]|uniref:RidA family protein n=1 Tax=Burkholderia sp. Ac-20353 TaxID=2703894 RepID=UPI00197B6CC2|nr:RidA family protein [Burkholderia sp. Ac-20353]MBN3787972.1 RidA family protein [Burkholderia sp. Ac-20353]
MASGTQRQSIVPPEFLAWHDTYHFTPATRVGDTIWVSGQVGVDAQMKIGEDVQAQTRIAFESLKTILAAAGATLADVVELTTFHTNLQADIELFSAVKDEYFPSRFPAWTAVGVTQLALPELCVEIRAMAVAGSGRV